MRPDLNPEQYVQHAAHWLKDGARVVGGCCGTGPEHKSVLVWALSHPKSEPALDWWRIKVPGFTPGNRIMRRQSKQMRLWLKAEFGIKAYSLPYQIEFGGAFLKDASQLASLGVI